MQFTLEGEVKQTDAIALHPRVRVVAPLPTQLLLKEPAKH